MTATATRPADSSSDGVLSHREVLTILSGLLLGMFLAALDQTVVSTAIKTIGNDLHDLTAQAWVTTAFVHAAQNLIAGMLYGGVFARHPDLTVVLEEMRVNWVPPFFQTLERQALPSF